MFSGKQIQAIALSPRVDDDLQPDPNPVRRLDLARGLEYTIIDRKDDSMRDGYKVPTMPDGIQAPIQGP